MRALTLGDIKNRTRIPASVGVCPTDTRLVAWLNEAVQRLITSGHWTGTTGRFIICATDGCITLPPQIASIERAAVCGRPATVRDQWYEFLENGMGIQAPPSAGSGSSCCSGGTASCGSGDILHRGWFPTFADIRGTAKKLVVVCDRDTDVGKRVLVLGYDENVNWIRTEQDSVVADGEVLELAQGSGTTSTKFYDGGITGIQFLDERDGQVWLYERDTVAATSRLIGSYQYWETNPSYARYLFTGVFPPSGSGCPTVQVEVLAKLEYMPVRVDTDYLLLTNVPALKSMVMAVKQYEEAVSSDDLQRAATYEAAALR